MKSVIVTGAGGGMGQATVSLLAEQGWHVLAIDRNADRVSCFANNAQVSTLVVDLSDQALVSLVTTAIATLPPLQGLVNMAGVSVGAPICDLTQAAWQAAFATNVDAPMLLTQLAANVMPQGSSIVNIGSPVGIVGANKPSYAASKAALHGLTMSCARNLGPLGIRVNLLLPGPTITCMTNDWPQSRRDSIAQGTFLKRLCTPEEVANTISFLLSPQASYFTGSVLDMTAGSLWGH
ncbi:hypothetical protein VT06_15805 [Arsukibacterium sp. MJ3]|uniref:SDR family NAD(P)-dependent oxidoreductase n=1 Tax=Arsukibacterium sp. MJ3 TaxID=1632859 RepID=UPI00062715C3|nr:SDR family oxidoreductase [Arsukibacterium sp. MJ3]KKO47669.1 hypothetical protein VT06_15805 [Arsukibacterium sp. MJ3]